MVFCVLVAAKNGDSGLFLRKLRGVTNSSLDFYVKLGSKTINLKRRCSASSWMLFTDHLQRSP